MSDRHIFISYSRKDTEFVEKLERDLNARGMVTWRDATSIVGSEDWYNAIIEGLEHAYAVILVVTVNADESRWVKREALLADRLRVHTIPVWPERYEARLNLEFLLIERQPVYCDSSNYPSGLAQITAKLGELAETQTVPAETGSKPALRATEPHIAARRTELDYLDLLLSEAEADLKTKLYVSLLATRDRKAHKAHSLGLPGERRPSLGRLGIQYVEGDDCDQPGDTVNDAREPQRALQRVLLLGEPGSGKTTTLLQLAIDLAQEARQALQNEVTPPPRLPVFLPLSSYSGEQPFTEFVQAHLGPLQSHYERLRDENRLVLLCDALNEMPRTENTHDPMDEVREHLRKRQSWVVSCRVRDYQEELKDLPDVGRVQLMPLDPPRIKEVIDRRFYEESERAAALWKDLEGSADLLAAWQAFVDADKTEAFWTARWVPDEVWSDGMEFSSTAWQQMIDAKYAWESMRRDNRRMLLLCRNPYMLFLVCEIFDLTASLPPNRGALFAAFVDDLLDREKGASRRTGREWIDASIIRRALAQLAFAMQRSETGTEISRDEAEKILLRISGVTDPALLLRLAASASLLDVGERVRFTHQLLQEYFASEVMGAALDEKRSATEFWPADRWWEPQGWEETAIILAGVRGDPGAVAQWLAPAQPEVAYQALTECGIEVDLDALQPKTRAALVNSANAKKDEPTSVGRAAAYRILGRFEADTRRGAGVREDGLPDIAWSKAVEPGPFQMGGDPEAYNDWTGAAFKLDYPFWLARYPVTYAQFEVFVKDGYTVDKFWTRQGSKWRGEKRHPEYGWRDPRWHIPNHPVVGVTWYEARAFTQWLDTLRRQGKLDLPPGAPGDWVIRLPIEAEWEKAARYPDGRKFPWGDEPDMSRMNSDESGIRRTSAVGIFPDGVGPIEAYDMSGNVWEWCLSGWSDDYHFPEDNDPEGGAARVLRGGSWFSFVDRARCACRGRDFPSDGNADFGFRVVCSAPMP